MIKIMKFFNIILLSSVILLFSNCKNCECTPENTLAMNDTTFNSLFECLDLEFIQKNNTHPNAKFSKSYIYSERYENGDRKIYIENGRAYINIDHSRYLSIYKIFYSDGKIKEKCLQNDFGFFIGKFYKFNESGSLVETIDMDKGFDFTFEQLKEKLTKEEKILFSNLHPIDDGGGRVEYPISIQKDTENQPMWRVRYKDKDNSKNGIYGTEVEIYYDGKTGELISREVEALNPNS